MPNHSKYRLLQGKEPRMVGPEKGRAISGSDVRPEFFWSHVDKTEHCWLWTGALDRVGYGQFNVGGKRTAAHRASYAMEHGATPTGACVCHSCDVRRCVRPSHLFLGSQKDNIRDAWSKGRASNNGGATRRAAL